MIEIRDGQRITGEGEFGVALLVDVEELGLASVRWEPGGGIPPPPHVHARHAECFVVLEGELTFHLEDREVRAGPETFTFVPAGVVHSFTVTGDSPARFLDLHVPSCRFGDFVRNLYSASSAAEQQAARDEFDQLSSEHATGEADLVVVTRAGGEEGEAIGGRSSDRRATLLVDSDELTVTEFAYGPGMRGADLHVHHTHADAFFVLEGELAIRTRDSVLAASAGTLVVIPPNVVHGFDNGPASSRFFNFHMPASGFADYMRGRNPDFDQHDPPADGGVDPAAIVAVRLSQ